MLKAGNNQLENLNLLTPLQRGEFYYEKSWENHNLEGKIKVPGQAFGLFNIHVESLQCDLVSSLLVCLVAPVVADSNGLSSLFAN